LDNIMKKALISLTALTTLALSGCASLPESGPTTSVIMNASHAQKSPYSLVELTPKTVASINAAFKGDALLKAQAKMSHIPRPTPLGLINRGDVITLTMWEPNPTGTTLLGHGELNTEINVDNYGDVLIPYVGSFHAAGLSPDELGRAIRNRLDGAGHHIQVSVFDNSDLGTSVMVGGAVNRPGRVNLAPGSRTVLDALALAGGPNIPDFGGNIRVSRDGVPVTIPLDLLVHHTSLDVRLAAGDQVMVLPTNHFFYALGAVNAPGEHSYSGHSISLTKALAMIGGLNDNLAAPRGVFVFRREPASVTKHIVSKLTSSNRDDVVYRLNMTSPDAFFVADTFKVRPDDVIYVSDAPVADLTKILQTISGVSNLGAIPRNFGAPY
jgi:polysaccharide export outer membrane protein